MTWVSFIRLLAGCWSLAGALDAISLDITEFRAGNHCCCELVVLCDWGCCFASFVWWLWHCPSVGGVMVAGWWGWGCSLGCTGCTHELGGHATALRQQPRPPHLVGLQPHRWATPECTRRPSGMVGVGGPLSSGSSLTDVWWLTSTGPFWGPTVGPQ